MMSIDLQINVEDEMNNFKREIRKTVITTTSVSALCDSCQPHHDLIFAFIIFTIPINVVSER